MRKKIFFGLLFFLGFTSVLSAQPGDDRARLEKEQKDLQKELKEIQGVYDKVKGQTKLTLSQLNVLKQKIKLQKDYIENIKQELNSINNDIVFSTREIDKLEAQLVTLKTEYASSVVYAYKNRSNYDYLNFIFSASSFNDAIRRVSYLKSYRTYREKQVSTILDTRQLIADRKKQQEVRQQRQASVVDNKTKQEQELEQQKKEKDAVVSKLKSKEKDLSKQIAAKKKRDLELKNSINAVVRRAMEASRKEAEKRAADEAKKIAAANPGTTPITNPGTTITPTTKIKTTTSKPTVIFNSEEDLKITGKFEAFRGRLPWPVDNGFVSIHFGKYDIEGTHLSGDNPGITISTQTGNAVKSVFDGEVVGVFNLGDGMAVTIRHGKYFTTYSNLTGVSVSKNAIVKTGQTLGKAGRDDDGNAGQIDFILMIESKNVNPEPWLHR